MNIGSFNLDFFFLCTTTGVVTPAVFNVAAPSPLRSILSSTSRVRKIRKLFLKKKSCISHPDKTEDGNYPQINSGVSEVY